MFGLQAAGEGGLELAREVESGESIPDLGVVGAFTPIDEANTERLAVGRQGGEGVLPALRPGQPLAQFLLIADGDARLLEGFRRIPAACLE